MQVIIFLMYGPQQEEMGLFFFLSTFDVDVTAKTGVGASFISSRDFCAFQVNSK